MVQTFSVTVAEVSDNATLAFKDSSGNAVSAAITGDHIVEDQAVPLFNGKLADLIAASNQGNYLSGLQSLIVATPGDIVGTPETITQINISIVDGSDSALTTALIAHYSALYDDVSDTGNVSAKIPIWVVEAFLLRLRLRWMGVVILQGIMYYRLGW